MIRPGDPTPALPGCYGSSGKPEVGRHFASTVAATLTGAPSIKRMFPEACCVRVDYHRADKANSVCLFFWHLCKNTVTMVMRESAANAMPVPVLSVIYPPMTIPWNPKQYALKFSVKKSDSHNFAPESVSPVALKRNRWNENHWLLCAVSAQ